MKIENQVSNLELSRKLKELGVKQESLWYWYSYNLETDWYITKEIDDKDKEYLISAFTVAELGEMLPKHIHNPKKDTPGTIDGQGDLTIRWVVEGCLVGYDCLSERLKKLEERLVPTMMSRTEVNARTKMLVYLLEKKLLSPKKL